MTQDTRAGLAVFGWMTAILAFCQQGRLIAGSISWSAQKLFQTSVSTNLQLTRDKNGIQLQMGQVIEDDGPAAGYSYRPNVTTLAQGTRIKKQLVIADQRARRAFLLVAPGGRLEAEINGQPCRLKLQGKSGNYWQVYPIQPGTLRRGFNDIVLFGSGKIWIARNDDFATGSDSRRQHPDRSAKSIDGGKTWNSSDLGDAPNVDGEYYVRLFLEQYASKGDLITSVIDVGNLTDQPIAPAVEEIDTIRVRLNADVPDETAIMTRFRTAKVHAHGHNGWSPWRTLPSDGTIRQPTGRFLQLAITLATENRLVSPHLRAITIESTTKRPKADWWKRIRVLRCQNPPIIRSAIPFPYEPWNHPRLQELRKTYRLDDVVGGSDSDFALVTKLARWAADRFHKGHLQEFYPAWDALEILRLHRDGTPVGGFCLQQNLVLLQACESFGLYGRVVSIGPGEEIHRIRSGHEAVEIWSNDHRKWVYIDANTGWYFADQATKTPLSLLELRQRQIQAWHGKDAPPTQMVRLAASKYEWRGFKDWPAFFELRLVPRSNFLQKKTPLPLNQGMRGWFWTGYYVWSDDSMPARPLYPKRVFRPGDFNWTLHHPHVTLVATPTPGRLRVYLDTQTPAFDTFMVKKDNQPFRPSKAFFDWQLKTGTNHMTVAVRNGAGRLGAESVFVMEY